MSLTKKLKNLGVGLGISALSLLPIKSLSQEQNNLNNPKGQTEQTQKKWETWVGWVGIGSVIPHDDLLKDVFKSYWAINVEGQAKISDNIYISPSFTYMWEKVSEDGYTLKVNGSEFSGLFVYKVNNFDMALGPTISTLNISGKGSNSNNFVTDNFSQLGVTFGMKVYIPINEKIGAFLIGRYTHMEKDEDEWPETLGTTKFGIGLQF